MPRKPHGRQRNAPNLPALDNAAVEAERARKQARKAKRRNDRAAKRKKGHN